MIVASAKIIRSVGVLESDAARFREMGGQNALPAPVDGSSITHPRLAEPAVARMLRQPRKFGAVHVYQRLVVACFEIDVRLLLQGGVDDRLDAVAHRRDRAEFAISEQLADFRLVGKTRLAAKLGAELGQLDAAVGW